MESLRSFVRKGLKAVGLRRISHPTYTDVMLRYNIDTVLDVGANDGQFGSEIRSDGYRGRIISFEPIASVFAELKRRAAADLNWDIFQIGLGEVEGERPISVCDSDVFSSFKAPSDYAATLWPGVRTTRQELVNVARLESLISENPYFARNAYLKIDTQGYEMEVLRGAGNQLRNFRFIQTELALTQLYHDQPNWIDVITWMKEQGFGVLMAKENGVDWNAMRLLELDIVFERLQADNFTH